jgi:hypothetical protein
MRGRTRSGVGAKRDRLDDPAPPHRPGDTGGLPFESSATVITALEHEDAAVAIVIRVEHDGGVIVSWIGKAVAIHRPILVEERIALFSNDPLAIENGVSLGVVKQVCKARRRVVADANIFPVAVAPQMVR